MIRKPPDVRRQLMRHKLISRFKKRTNNGNRSLYLDKNLLAVNWVVETQFLDVSRYERNPSSIDDISRAIKFSLGWHSSIFYQLYLYYQRSLFEYRMYWTRKIALYKSELANGCVHPFTLHKFIRQMDLHEEGSTMGVTLMLYVVTRHFDIINIH